MLTCLPDAISAWPCNIVYLCSPKLADLSARSFPEIEVKSQSYEPYENFLYCDYHLPMGSLPLHFRTSFSAFPASRNHFVADPELVKSWHERLVDLGQKPKIGICWRSLNNSWRKRPQHSQLVDWNPVLDLTGLTFINLQSRLTVDDHTAIKAAFGADFHVFDDLNLEQDIENSAALISSLDAVITARCWIMSFSAGLGTKTYVFSSLPNPNMMELPYDPFFPDTEVYYRDFGETWDGPMAAIADRLKQTFGEKM